MPAELVCLLRTGDHLQAYIVKSGTPAVLHTGGLLVTVLAF